MYLKGNLLARGAHQVRKITVWPLSAKRPALKMGFLTSVASNCTMPVPATFANRIPTHRRP